MLLRGVVTGLVFWCLLELTQHAACLKEGDVGICVGQISSMNRRIVQYTKFSHKWCGKRRCVVKASKAVPHVVVSNVTYCCSGWGYDPDRDNCEPRCSTGCEGGRCVAPEKCQCDPPLYLDLDKNTCIRPHCEIPCVNGECIANNTCKCLPNFDVYNSSHCYQCEQGYVVDKDFKCVPSCDTPCVNATCTSPNSCKCLPGYSHTDNFTCSPKCDGCVNSLCVSPNKCACFEGYTVVNGTYCAPICEDCANGYCASPNVCECNAGYEKVNGVCKPFCGGSCENGVCSEPGICSCIKDYQKNATDPRKCFRPCNPDCQGKCDVHGSCFCEETVKDMISPNNTYNVNKITQIYNNISDENLVKAEKDKENKYLDLAHEIFDMWDIDSAIIVPIVISVHGLIAKSLDKHLKRLALGGWIKSQMQKAVLLVAGTLILLPMGNCIFILLNVIFFSVYTL